jgi:hypothetical protein
LSRPTKATAPPTVDTTPTICQSNSMVAPTSNSSVVSRVTRFGFENIKSFDVANGSKLFRVTSSFARSVSWIVDLSCSHSNSLSKQVGNYGEWMCSNAAA